MTFAEISPVPQLDHLSCTSQLLKPLRIILAVDEPIYRRLPCFMIATVDKFAAMPWTGEVGGFFGRVNRVDAA